MKLRLSHRARQDIAEIGCYIAAHDAQAARRVGDALRASLDRLAAFPLSGSPIANDLRRAAVPRLPYVIYYRVDTSNDRILVATIRHAARGDSPAG